MILLARSLDFEFKLFDVVVQYTLVDLSLKSFDYRRMELGETSNVSSTQIGCG